MFAFGFAILWIFPVIWLIISSFKDGSELFNYPLTILPEHFTLENYTTALQQFDLIRYTSNTAFITVAATVITVLMSCMCGYALAKYKYKWLNVLFMCLLATTMLPTEVIMSPSFTVLNTLGLYNSLWGGGYHTDRRNHDWCIFNEAVLHHCTDRTYGISANRRCQRRLHFRENYASDL